MVPNSMKKNSQDAESGAGKKEKTAKCLADTFVIKLLPSLEEFFKAFKANPRLNVVLRTLQEAAVDIIVKRRI